MNDATDAVDDAPWLAPDWAQDGPPPPDFPPPPGQPPDGPHDTDPRLAALQGIDWQAWAARDPQAAGAAWRVLTGPAPDQEQEQGSEPDDRDQRLQAVEAELARDIEGWSPELRADLAAYGQARGFTPEELAGVEDPREIKILHLAMLGEQALAAQRQAQLQAEAFGRFRPPTQAGDLDLQTPGRLMCGRRVRGATLVFSDVDVWAATYLGGVAVYGFQRVGADCGVVSKGCAVSLDSRAVWMGRGAFFAYDGGAVEALPCEVADHVFQDLNAEQISKVSAWHNADHGEVWWHYPSEGAFENDRYVAWSYRTGKWAVGELARTCGTSAGVFQNPLLVGPDGRVFEHEVGWAWDGAAPFARSAPLELGSGDRVMTVSAVVGDERTRGEAQVRFYARAFPNEAELAVGPVGLTTAPADVRLSARQVETRVDFTAGADSRVGVLRLEVRAAGRR